jgi:hypothetical protein
MVSFNFVNVSVIRPHSHYFKKAMKNLTVVFSVLSLHQRSSAGVYFYLCVFARLHRTQKAQHYMCLIMFFMNSQLIRVYITTKL